MKLVPYKVLVSELNLHLNHILNLEHLQWEVALTETPANNLCVPFYFKHL